MVVGPATGGRLVGRHERLVQPLVEIAPIRQRAAFDDAALVEPVEKEPAPSLRNLGLVQRAERSRRADHQGGSLPADAACAEVGARAVDPRRVPHAERLVGDLRELRHLDADRVEQLAVPAPFMHVEQPGARGERGAHRDVVGTEQPGVEVFGEGDEPVGLLEDVRRGLREPRELCRPEARVQWATRPRMNGLGIEPPRQPCGGVCGSRIAPAEDLRQRFPAGVEGQQRMAEARGRGRAHVARHGLLDRVGRQARDRVGIVPAGVPPFGGLAVLACAIVEDVGANGGCADVDGQHARHAGDVIAFAEPLYA